MLHWILLILIGVKLHSWSTECKHFFRVFKLKFYIRNKPCKKTFLHNASYINDITQNQNVFFEGQLVSFGRSNTTGTIDVKMDGSLLEENSSFKMPGLTFPSKLDWSSYIISINC